MTAQKIEGLAAAIHEAAVAKGFWDVEDAEKKHLAKMISELGEVVQADRAGVMYEIERDGGKPEGVAAELADFAMMALDWLAESVTLNHGDECMSRLRELDKPMYAPLRDYPVYELVIMFSRNWKHFHRKNTRNPEAVAAMYEMVGMICWWLKARGYDLWALIREKLAYNESRPKLHGRAY